MSDFDELRRFAINSQMTLGDLKRVEKVRDLPIATLGAVSPVAPPMLDPAFFYKACASLLEIADRFAMMFGDEEFALYELLPRFRNESLPTIWRCFDPHTVEGEIMDLPGHPFWTRRNVDDLRVMIKKHTGLGIAPDGRPFKICGVYGCRQRLDTMCPLATENPDSNGLEMIRTALRRALPGANGNYNRPWIGEKTLEPKAQGAWEYAVRVHGRPDLIDYLDTGLRDKVRRAVGRKS